MTQTQGNRGLTFQPPVVVVALHPHRAEGILRATDEEYALSRDTAAHLQSFGLVKVLLSPSSAFDDPRGRMLRTEVVPARPLGRVVACLNIWQDRLALEQTMRTWYDHVDHVIAIDGAYHSTGRPGPSTDGTIEFLEQQSKVELVRSPDRGWPDQNAKRNAYLERLRLEDLAIVIDADEFVSGAECLRRPDSYDVGWVMIESSLYQRPYGQPRAFRARPGLQYRGRHHWIYAGDELLATHQYAGLAEHAALPIRIRNARGLGHDNARANAKRMHAIVQSTVERDFRSSNAGAVNDARDAAREALRILQVAKYDAGLAVSRLHTAVNATSPHGSVMFTAPEGRPYGVPGQHPLEDRLSLGAIAHDADVLHLHLTLSTLEHEQLRAARWLVLHHHGSMLRQAPDFHRGMAEQYRALTLVSTLELLKYAPSAEWLPNPMPVERYRRLRAEHWQPSETFRVAHSPSKRHLKGTDTFLEVVDRLRTNGIPIEAVLIEGMPHGEALARKASCDACFDAFFIGIQCSGLEAAAMGMPVIAGDLFAAGRYVDIVGDVPYTFAADAKTLELQLVELQRNHEFRAAETRRVVRYVRDWHDEAAVTIRYLDLLDRSFGWRDALALGKPEPKTPKREPVTTPEPPAPQTPKRPAPRTPQREPVEVG